MYLMLVGAVLLGALVWHVIYVIRREQIFHKQKKNSNSSRSE